MEKPGVIELFKLGCLLKTNVNFMHIYIYMHIYTHKYLQSMLGFGFAMAENQLFTKSLTEDDAT